MARLTRHDLKKDELRTTFEQVEQFVKQRSREIVTVAGLIIVVVGSTAGLKFYLERQQDRANARLSKALKTFRAYVGTAAAGTLSSDTETYPTAQEKYKKALEEFREIVRRFPRTKAATVAQYHVGVCQVQMGDHSGGSKTLQEASRTSDRNIAALAQLALAAELAKEGKTDEAAKLAQQLADHPTTTVPKATALLTVADAYHDSRPAQARQIYERMQKEFSSEPSVERFLAEQVANLPK